MTRRIAKKIATAGIGSWRYTPDQRRRAVRVLTRRRDLGRPTSARERDAFRIRVAHRLGAA